jgi:hypothetical protein
VLVVREIDVVVITSDTAGCLGGCGSEKAEEGDEDNEGKLGLCYGFSEKSPMAWFISNFEDFLCGICWLLWT